jgi:type I restriction enzyme, S subunit
MRPTADVSSNFLYQLTQLAQFRLLGIESMTGAAGQQRISQDFVANFDLPVPPINEQQEILAFIASETSKFRAAIERANREIDLILEYRTRLIADVVTGRVDVREVTKPSLLATGDESTSFGPEAMDDRDLLADDDFDEDVEGVVDAD